MSVSRDLRGGGVPRLGTAVAVVGLAMALSACAIQPDPYSTEELQQKAAEQYASLFSEQEPIQGPLGLYEAMARAVRYNLDQRVRVMEEAFSQRQLDLARYDLLPQVNAGASATRRNNVNASSSRSVITGQESLEPSTSQDQNLIQADLNVVWNVLDFGIGYYAANQQADRALIAQEQRRRIVQQIIQDVRSAYWRAVAGQRLLGQIDPLLERVEAARADSRRIEQLRLRSPLEALSYQRSLIDTQRQLHDLRRELLLAKTELATLMNLPPDRPFEVAMPDESDFSVPRIEMAPDELEILALTYRPELREDIYQTRISRDETRKAMLRMLPGIEFNTGLNYDSNSFLVNQTWYEYGARISWNLLNLLTGPTRIDLAETQEDLVQARRRATAAAVVTQAHVAWITFQESRQDFVNSADLVEIDDRILAQFRAGGRADRLGDLPIIQSELNLLLSQLRRDLAYARLQSASGQVLLSVGADPLPDSVADGSLDTLAAAIRETEELWQSGALAEAAFVPEEPLADTQQPAAPVQEGADKAGPDKAGPGKAGPDKAEAEHASAEGFQTAAAEAPAPRPAPPSTGSPALSKPAIERPQAPAAPSRPTVELAPAGRGDDAPAAAEPAAPRQPGTGVTWSQPGAPSEAGTRDAEASGGDATAGDSVLERFFQGLTPGS